MNWWKLGFLVGGSIVLLNVSVVLLVLMSSDAEEQMEYATAALTNNLIPPPPDIALTPYPIRVRSSDRQIGVGFVSIRMEVDKESHRREVCQRLSQVTETLNLTIGSGALSRDEWHAVTTRRVANLLRTRFNRALASNRVERVVIDRGRGKFFKGVGCDV